MVLAVHVVGDGAAQRDKPGAGHDREKPALRYDNLQDFVQGQARLATQDAPLRIEVPEPFQLACAQLGPVAVDAAVAVAAPLPEGQSGILVRELRQGLETPVPLDHAGRSGERQATPGRPSSERHQDDEHAQCDDQVTRPRHA